MNYSLLSFSLISLSQLPPRPLIHPCSIFSEILFPFVPLSFWFILFSSSYLTHSSLLFLYFCPLFSNYFLFISSFLTNTFFPIKLHIVELECTYCTGPVQSGIKLAFPISALPSGTNKNSFYSILFYIRIFISILFYIWIYISILFYISPF